jgi:hypothetical protein
LARRGDISLKSRVVTGFRAGLLQPPSSATRRYALYNLMNNIREVRSLNKRELEDGVYVSLTHVACHVL